VTIGTALVTGASSGIGEAFADRLAADGHDLVLVARRRGRLEEVAARLTAAHGVGVRVVEADLGEREQLDALCADVPAIAPRLVVNNAALAHYGPFAELDPSRATELVDLNVLAPVRLTRAALPGMIERGDGGVVNVCSLLAFSGTWEGDFLPQRATYAATKAFLVAFSQVAATELRGTGVRVQALCPGLVRSEFHTRQGMDTSAMQRMEPEDVVRASLSDLADGVVVSIPGAEDAAAYEPLAAASLGLMPLTRTVELPSRFRR
jgi:uncharacterized protein